MKKVYHQCLFAVLLLLAFLLIMNGVRRKEEALVSRLAPEVLRFHVLANSNSAEDQALKLEVKDFLLDALRPHMLSKKDAQDYIIQNRDDLEDMTESFIRTLGYEYPAKICLETCMFPTKTYGALTFPAGMYDAVRVLIGDGAGENFWCVLYPSLCYLDSAYAVVPESSKELLKAVLPEDDFQALLAARRTSGRKKTEQDVLLPRVTFRLKFFELFAR